MITREAQSLLTIRPTEAIAQHWAAQTEAYATWPLFIRRAGAGWARRVMGMEPTADRSRLVVEVHGLLFLARFAGGFLGSGLFVGADARGWRRRMSMPEPPGIGSGNVAEGKHE
jgi:hypothetical protein